MANNAKSKDKIRPILPRDMSNIQREGKADKDSQFTAGALLCRKDGYLVLCDTADVTDGAFFEQAPVEVLWTDGVNRYDIVRIDLDGTEHKELTTFVFDFVAEVDVSLFTVVPTQGQFLMKGPGGQMVPGDVADVTAAGGASNDGTHLVVGQVIEAGQETDKFVVKFRLA